MSSQKENSAHSGNRVLFDQPIDSSITKLSYFMMMVI